MNIFPLEKSHTFDERWIQFAIPNKCHFRILISLQQSMEILSINIIVL